MKFVAPQRGTKSFTCPYCGVLARQYHKSSPPALNGNFEYHPQHQVCITKCESCERHALWWGDKLVVPNSGNAPPPNPDLPADATQDYLDAVAISTLSPRGAAALLRLAIQKLCIHLGGNGDNLNADIGLLVTKGLSPTVQKSLDVVRVIGNNAVHPGQIHTDDPEVVGHLFTLINVITEAMISVPKQIDTLYAGLPEGARDAIERRDRNNA